MTPENVQYTQKLNCSKYSYP